MDAICYLDPHYCIVNSILRLITFYMSYYDMADLLSVEV
jgi:hypothetical protein